MLMMAALVCAALMMARGLTADEPTKPKDEVKEMMVKVHRGEKSALGRTTAELKKEKPDWELLAKDAKEFAAMGEKLKGTAAYTSPAKYISRAAALDKAVGEKDQKAATEAFTGLNTSCSSCHYGKPK
jgi:hypothetical protein